MTDNEASNRAWLDAQRRGDFAAAWEISDTIRRARGGAPTWHLPRHLQTVWDGTPLLGKRVLVRCYHGLGDTIQFSRYLPLLTSVAAEVIVWVQPSLLELLRGVPGTHRLLSLHDGQPDAEYDVDLEIMELPYVFRTTAATLPAKVPYLHAPPASPGSLGADRSFKVGVVWRAGDWDERRSVPASSLASLAAVPGVTLHALQRGRALAEWRPEFGPVSGSDRVAAVASLMQTLDLVLSVDSFPAHLAGALGRPVWTLLHSAADWRWLEDRDDSPWYPTMRLFRQTEPGRWGPVMARVATELRRLAGGMPPGGR